MKKLKKIGNQIYHFLFETKGGNILFFIIAISIIVLYLTLYFFKEPIVDEEVRTDSMNNLVPWEVKKGDSFIKAMVARPFNLNNTELGQYRPRYLAFLVQFLDENIFFKLVRWIPTYGNRVPFFPVAMFLTVFSIYYFLTMIWKKLPKGFCFFIASTVIMFQNYQVTTYWRARSAKLLAVSACVWILTYALKKMDIKFEKKDYKKLIISIPIFLLMTLDEQVLALTVFLTGLAFLITLLNKEINFTLISYTISSFLYGTFHLFWGKWLFNRFTGEFKVHGHTIEGAISGISFASLKKSFEILKTVVPKLIFLSFLIFIILWLYAFMKIKNKKEKKNEIIISLFLFIMPFILLMVMIDSHDAIYYLPCLWKSVYPMISGILLFLSLFYVLSISSFKYKKIIPVLLLFGISFSLIYNIKNVNHYYGAYLKSNGGFLDEVTDMEIGKDYIDIKAVPEEDMQFKNDSVWSSLHTPFTTSNFKTAKISSGKRKKKSNDYYITEYFSCYLNTKRQRKLVLDAYVDNIEDYESLTISINKYEIKTLPISQNEMKLTLDVRSERYRAGKVTLIFHRKEGTKERNLNKTIIKMNKLYMK